MSPSRVSALALCLAAVSLLLAAYVFWSRPQPIPSAPVSGFDREGEIDALRTQLTAIERRLGTAEDNALRATRALDDLAGMAGHVDTSKESDGSDVRDDDAGDDSRDDKRDDNRGDEPAERTTTPRFVEFEIVESGLDIHQAENGSLRVSNSNPALDNQTVTVQARDENGKVHELLITVPPAE